MKKKLSIVLAVVLTLTLLLTSTTFAGGGKKEVVPAQMVLDASLSEVSTVFDIPKADLEVATSRGFSFGADKFLLSSIVDKKSKQAYMVSTDAQGKVWIAEPKIEDKLVDYMSQMKPKETVPVSIWAIYVSPEEELWQIPSKYPDVPFEGYLPALGADVSPEVLDSIDADIEEIKLRANEEAVQPVVDFLQSTGSTILYVSKYAPLVIVELSKEDVYKLARLPEAESISLPNEELEPCMDTAAYTINADDVWDEGYDGGMSDGSGHRQTEVAVIDTGIDFTHDALTHADGGRILGGTVDGDHGTAVAGCVASIGVYQGRDIKGIAYGTKILDADYGPPRWWWQDYGRIVAACDWAHSQRADIYNFSSGINYWGGCDNIYCKYFDHIAYVWQRLPVCGSGNEGHLGVPVTSPANAWNVLAVGGINDKNTEDWSDDVIWHKSCWENPDTPHGDREKPEVCAPAVDITTTRSGGDFLIESGTSLAAPQVSGIAAMLMEKNYVTLMYFPILTKAIIMASAIHNVDNDFPGGELGFPGEGPDDDNDGVGTVDAYAAYDCLSSDRGRLWVDWKEGDSLSPYSLEFDAVAGETVRFVITWYAHTDYSGSSYYGDGLCADLGLEITGTGYYWGEVTFGESHSYDNAWEIVQFYPPYTGTYRATISADAWTGWGEYIAAACYRWQPVREDFEWGSEGEPLSNDGNNVGWTVTEFGAGGTASAEIDESQYHPGTGTRSAEFYSDYNGWDITVGVRASYPEDCPEWRGFWAMTSGNDDITNTGWVTATGDGDKFLSVRVKPGGRLQYRQDSYWWHDTNPVFIISPDRWYFIEFRNIDWEAGTYSIYVDGDCVQDGVPMVPGTDWHGLDYSGITAYATDDTYDAGGGSFWIDDIYYPRVGG